VISVIDLSKSFSSSEGSVLAVDRVSFAVPPSQVFGLLGENGAGKTTILRMILGLLVPSGGYTEVGGFRTSESPDEVKRYIGFVSSSAGLYPWHTPRELLLYFAELYGVPRDTARNQIGRLTKQFGLTPFLDRRCSFLSTGQKQRVNLARSLIHDPPIILMDEPTRGLDVMGSKEVFDYVALARESGKAVILCTHRLDEAERFCDCFGLLHRGRLLRRGTLSELRAATGCHSLTEMFLRELTEVPS
jgi:ABC-2 type transport system ATP-binding protein/sodium transport system ATP-binding protein